jgi:zinc protease
MSIETRALHSLSENVRQTQLENGLIILTQEIQTVPVVGMQVWYKFGSLNEALGVNGIAHLLEHMMFKGTRKRPIQFGYLFDALGSHSNAFTSYDKTVYFNMAERDKLEALLILEADRMQNALIDADELETEKKVVLNELLLYENNPQYRLYRAVMRATFPRHPYGFPVSGTQADVERLTVEQVRSYYRNYYCPERAVLVIVGNFQTEPILKTVRETFDRVPKSSSPESEIENHFSPSTPPSNNLIVLGEPGSVPLMLVVYPLPKLDRSDVVALDVMDFILTRGRNSRLYKALVESGLVSTFSSGVLNLSAGGWYSLLVTSAPGQELEKTERILHQLVANLQTHGVTAEELHRAKTKIRANIIFGNRTPNDRAMQLGDSQLTTGDYRYPNRYLTELAQIGTAEVEQVAREYLKPAYCTVGFFDPTQIEGESCLPETKTDFSQIAENFSLGISVSPAAIVEYLPPITSEKTCYEPLLFEKFTLANGLQVLLLPDSSYPTVTLSGYIRAGKEFDPETKAGLASLTAQNLMSGTKSRDKLTLAKTLENRGAKLWFDPDREGVYLGGLMLAPDSNVLMQTLADVFQNATFPAEQLELSRQRRLTALKVALNNPEYLARRLFQERIYPENHPFHWFPTEATLKAINREDVVRFYQKYYRPDTTLLALMGNFQPAKLREQLENLVGGWQVSGQPPVRELPQVPQPSRVLHWHQALPGVAESIVYMGYPSIDRLDSRFYAALVLNQILGGDILSSRLGAEIRDRLGLTYSIYSHFQVSKRTGFFNIRIQAAPKDIQRLIAMTLTLLQQVRDRGVTETEVETSKRSIISTHLMVLANSDLVCDEILINEVYGLTGEELLQFPQKIRAVTLTQVNQVAKELLHPTQMVVVTAGPLVTT